MESAPLLRSDDKLPLDKVFEILKNERRRLVLDYLDKTPGPVEIGVLAEEIAAHENETTAARVDSTQRKRVYVALYQCHLPKMADLGVVEYDRRGGRVELTDEADAVLTMARRPVVARRSWHRYYGGVGAGLMTLLVVNSLDLLPVHLAANVLTGLAITALVGLSLAHGLISRRGAGD